MLFKRSTKTVAFSMILMLCIIAGYLWRKPAPIKEENLIKEVEIEIVSNHTISNMQELIGTIQAQHATTLLAKRKGILDPKVSSGKTVKKGELLAKIHNPDIERHDVLSEKAEQIAKLQYERANQLFNSGVSSKNVVEDYMKSWIEAQKNRAAAKIALDEIQIQAPFDGIVGLFKVHEGSQVSEGDPLVVLYDPSSLIVEFDVPLDIARLIHPGSPVWIDEHTYPLTQLQKILDPESHMCPATVDIECKTCILGSTISVQVVLQQKESALTVPFDAIFVREGQPYVYLVKNNQALLTPVQLGIREKNRIEVTQGVEKGDSVIIRGQARLYPGISVHIYTESLASKIEAPS